MNPRRRIGVIAMAATLVVVLLAGGAWRARREQRTNAALGPVIAEVDGHPIYLSQAKARVQGIGAVHSSLKGSPGSAWQQQILDSLVDDVIVQGEAVRRGIVVSDSQVAAAVADLSRGYPTEAAFDSWLSQQGMDRAELERRIRINLLTSRVYVAVTSSARVSTEQLRAYYRAHRDRFLQGSKPDPFFEARSWIEQRLQKQARDQMFGTWLKARRGEVHVQVLRPDWWRSVS